MAARLIINEKGYILSLLREEKWVDIATLDGGATALISDTALLNDAVIEHAIDRAEDWLMPHARALRSETLQIDDIAGHFSAGLLEILAAGARAFSVPDIEAHFLKIADLATGRSASPALRGRNHFVADLVLVRELAHHGALASVQLAGKLLKL